MGDEFSENEFQKDGKNQDFDESSEFNENEVNSDLVEDSVEKQGEEDLDIGKQVDEWFEKLDTDNDGCLNIKDIKPYVE